MGKRRAGDRGERVVLKDPRASEATGNLTATGDRRPLGVNRCEMRNEAGEVLLKIEMVCPVCTERLREAYERRRLAKQDKRGAR